MPEWEVPRAEAATEGTGREKVEHAARLFLCSPAAAFRSRHGTIHSRRAFDEARRVGCPPPPSPNKPGNCCVNKPPRTARQRFEAASRLCSLDGRPSIPGTLEDHRDRRRYRVDDATGQAIGWWYADDEPTRRDAMQGMTRANARRFVKA